MLGKKNGKILILELVVFRLFDLDEINWVKIVKREIVKYEMKVLKMYNFLFLI